MWVTWFNVNKSSMGGYDTYHKWFGSRRESAIKFAKAKSKQSKTFKVFVESGGTEIWVWNDFNKLMKHGIRFR